MHRGLPKRVWTNATKLGRELISFFPADRVKFQKAIVRALMQPRNAGFFYGLKYFFESAENFINRRCEKLLSNMPVDEADVQSLDNVESVIIFLQSLCEGHFRPMQN